MDYTTKISVLKRALHNYSARISAGMTRPFQKFVADICYGAMAAKSCVLSEIAQALQEDTQKINMVLATNLSTDTKNLAITAMRHYFSRWRIKEYFRYKKQMFDFKNFRVRSLTAINSLNFFLSTCMLFLAIIRENRDRNMIFRICVEAAAPRKPKVYFFYYRLVEGLHFILSKAHTGIRGCFKTLRPNQRQMKIHGFT